MKKVLKNIYHEIKKKKVNIYHSNSKKINLSNPKKVSVIIPNYNYENYIIERIDSILRQTYPIHEIIILDDCSSDNSLEVIKRKIAISSEVEIKLITNNKNSGCVFSQWTKGLSYVTGDYFWIAEADDSCEPTFLETVMRGFDNKDVVLSYCESARINEHNVIITSNSRDLSDIFKSGDWDNDFVHKGIDEIKNKLSVTNTILNVSSVVWKKRDYSKIFEEAKKFKVAGDWYIYYKILLDGDLAYFKQSLNYYRKHKSSVTTKVKADLEYKEIKTIQDSINELFVPISMIKHQQNVRKSFMKESVSINMKKELENFERKKIAMIIPYPVKGSGGHRTLIQNANALVNYGYECDIYVEEDWVSTDEDMRKMLTDFYGPVKTGVYVGLELRHKYDLLFATAWTTADYVNQLEAPIKGYFIQDYEPWFEPMGNSYIEAEKTYKYGFKFITIGKWLAHKVGSEFDCPVRYFNFCADLKVYKPLENVEKEDAVCFIFQPEKWRRCYQLGLKALRIVKKLRPNTKIYLYGSKVEPIDPIDFEAENLHIIPIEECNKLYNKCKVGFCISASNPSRIPFEMMAAGLPVVDLHRENNLYDMPSGGVLLADSTPESIASSILKILDDKKLQKKMSKFGFEYMQKYPLEQGFNEFLEAVEEMLNTDYKTKSNPEMLFKEEPIPVTMETFEMAKEDKYPIYRSHSGKFKKRLIRLKRKIKRVLRLR